MQLVLHQSKQTIGDFDSIFNELLGTLKSPAKTEELHLFPELFLTGYPLQDLCLQRTFIEGYLALLEKLDAECLKLAPNTKVALVGGLAYEFDESTLPLRIYNVIFKMTPGKKMERIYTKRLLPNYDIFDEKKYFDTVKESQIHEFFGKRMAVMICEDMWASSTHAEDPTDDLLNAIKETGPVEAVINLSASPFFAAKQSKRVDRAMEISQLAQAPFYYVNRVGGEDEILFDGQSFAVNGQKLIGKAKRFLSETKIFELENFENKANITKSKIDNTWESLFSPQFETKNNQLTLKSLSDENCGEILEALCFGLQEYSQKCGFKKFTVALSGGIDSALVLTIARLSLSQGQEIEAVYMPGMFSSGMSYELSYELCQKLGVKLYSLPIKFFHSSIRNAFTQSFNRELSGLSDENIQSRLRGSLIYARANQIDSMVINTSNKSEISVGYSTQYGDSVGAISLLGDLYKTEVFELAKYINKRYDNLIPEGIISRPPSAELKENQKDQDSLPPYDKLDCILEGILSYRLSLKQIVELGFDKETVGKVFTLYKRSEYKRSQFCPIIKLKPKSFGFGYRVPITHKYTTF